MVSAQKNVSKTVQSLRWKQTHDFEKMKKNKYNLFKN